MREKNKAMLVVHDAPRPTRDLSEWLALKPTVVRPSDATVHNGPDTSRRAKIFVPWLYDFDHGWTPRRERLEPRPPLQLPPYFLGTFPLRTCGLRDAKHYFITIDLRPFPAQARVFLRLPLSIFSPAVVKKLRKSRAPIELGAHVRVVRRLGDFNRIFGERLRQGVSRDEVLVELEGGKRVILQDLRLPTDLVTLHVYYGVLREYLRPKTYYTTQLAQFIDHRLVGTFNHLLQAHHNYDVPVIGDRRVKTAYRRSSREVADIPPLALAFFETWKEAQAAGYDFAPRSFGKHFAPDKVSVALAKEILAFMNQRRTSAKILLATVVDNPYVNALGATEHAPERKVSIDLKTAENIVAARARLPKARFTRLQEIAAVKGVGPDTMSDIITSLLDRRLDRVGSGKGRWQPDPKVIKALRVDGA